MLDDDDEKHRGGWCHVTANGKAQSRWIAVFGYGGRHLSVTAVSSFVSETTLISQKKKRPRRQTNWEAWTAVLGRWTYRFLPRTPKGYRFELVRGAVAIDDAGVASRRRGHPILSTVGPGLNALLYAAMTVSAMTDNILKEMRCVRITRRPTKSTRSSRRRIGCPPRRRARGESSPTKSTRCSRGGSCDPRR